MWVANVKSHEADQILAMISNDFFDFFFEMCLKYSKPLDGFPNLLTHVDP
jgi:hypothetical protein